MQDNVIADLIGSRRFKQSGSEFQIVCPAHESDGRDFNASLTVKNGWPVANCFSGGCTNDEILAALGWEKPAPAKDKDGKSTNLDGGDPEQIKRAVADCETCGESPLDGVIQGYPRLRCKCEDSDYERHWKAMVGNLKKLNLRAEFWSDYELADENPDPRRRFRYEPPAPADDIKGAKTVRWDKQTGRPLKNAKILIWGDPEAPTKVVTEGEKSAAALMSAGLDGVAAVTWSSGASGAAAADWSPLATTPRVMIWADADDAGAGALRAAGGVLRTVLPATAKLLRVDTDGLPHKSDAADVASAEIEGRLDRAAELSMDEVDSAKKKTGAGRPALTKGWDVELEPNPVTAAVRLLKAASKRLLVAFHRGGGARVFLADDTGIWSEDEGELLTIFNRDVAGQWMQDAMKAELDDKTLGRLAGKINEFHAPGRFQAVIDACASAVGILRRLGQTPKDLTTCHERQLDAKHRYLGAENGVIDLKTATLLTGGKARRTLTTQSAAAVYDPNARTDDVDMLFGHLPKDDKNWLLAALGAAVWGNPNRRFYFLLGPGGEGKGTVLTAVHSALGEYAGTISRTALAKTKNGGGAGLTPELEPFVTKRLVIYHEWGADSPMDSERVKTVSGNDELAYRRLHENFAPEARRASATLFISANSLPGLDLWEDALWERFRVLRYTRPPEIVRDLRRRLADNEKNRAAMLAMLVKAAQENPAPPADAPSVAAARASALEESIGEVGIWLRSAVARSEAHTLSATELWEAGLEKDGKAGGDRAFGLFRGTFTRRARGILKLDKVESIWHNGGKARGWKGYRLLTPAEIDASDEAEAPPPPPEQRTMEVAPEPPPDPCPICGRTEGERDEFGQCADRSECEAARVDAQKAAKKA